MKLVFFVEKEKLESVKNSLSKDPFSRHSATIRDAEILESERKGNFILFEGSEKVCKDLKEELEGLAEELKGEKKSEIMEKIQEEEESAMKGFGGIFS